MNKNEDNTQLEFDLMSNEGRVKQLKKAVSSIIKNVTDLNFENIIKYFVDKFYNIKDSFEANTKSLIEYLAIVMARKNQFSAKQPNFYL